jgi:signal transduction histidine kinase
VARTPRGHGAGERDVLRLCVPFIAAGVVGFAAVTDPGGVPPVALLAAAVCLFALWAAWSTIPTLVLAVGVLGLVVLAKGSGDLDGGLFLLSLLAVVVAGWEPSRTVAAAACAAAVATPLLVNVRHPGDVDALVWMIGIAMPGIMSRLFRRQEELRAQLEEARRELTERRVSEERRRIARDVHDLVGHGLAAVLLQVASARHTLRRDLDEADDALRTAEDAGRRSLAELRTIVGLLRADGESTVSAVPGLGQLQQLVDGARAGGLAVERRIVGDHEGVDPLVGLALYRIAQEALLNAARHAPNARTVVTTRVYDRSVELLVETLGPLHGMQARGEPPRSGYGLVGMRERAAAVGGELRAGPTPEGWSVRCVVPIDGRTSTPASGAVS